MRVSPTPASCAATSPARSTRWSSRSTPPAAGPRPRRGRRSSSGSCTGRSAELPRARVALPASRLQLVPGYAPGARRARPMSRLRAATRPARSRSSGARSRRSRCPSYVAQLGDLLACAGRTAEAREQYGARRRDRADPGGERRQGSTSRPRSTASTTGSASRDTLALARLAHGRAALGRAATTCSAWALARNGRCGEALAALEARRSGSARATRLVLLPPRHDRALPRPARRRAGSWFRARRSTLNPHFSLLWSPTARRYARMKRLLVTLAAASPRSLAPAAALAHPLGNFTSTGTPQIELVRRPRLRPLRARPGRDPDLPARDARPRASASPREAGRAVSSSGSTAAARRCACSSTARSRATWRRRPEDAALRRRLRPRPAAGRGSRSATATSPRGSAGGKSSSALEDGAALRIGERARRRAASNDLRAYPKDLLRSPLDVTTATAVVRRSATAPGTPPVARRRHGRRAIAKRRLRVARSRAATSRWA